tara:strand:- start:836 stop:2092 length:1257 start_codon:yes stop_codon:yes gene_type:complete
MAKTQSSSDAFETRDLRTGKPVWLAEGPPALKARKTPRHATYDVIIVGSGISGALTAWHVCNGKRRVLLIDRRPPVTGSTPASTAMIQYEIDTPLHKLSDMIGETRARRAWQRSAAAVTRLGEIVRDENIACGYAPKPALYLAGDEFGFRALQTEQAAREAAGLTSRYLSAQELRETYGMDRTGALLSEPSASADPAQLTAGLLRRAIDKGLEIVSPLEVRDFVATGEKAALTLSNDQIITCGHAVFCTGYEFLKALESRQHRIISTWAVAARPRSTPPGWLDDHIVWEGSDPYLYFRTHTDGHMVIGGEDEPFETGHMNEAKLQRKAATLVEKFETLTGVSLYPPSHKWAAAFGESTTGLPFLGTVPGHTNIHALMGFGGNGITFSVIGAEIVARAIDGESDPDASLFAFPGDTDAP